MDLTQVLLLAFLIGVVAGLRSLTAPAAVALAAHQNWMNLQGTALSFMGSIVAVFIFILLAIGELIADQLPSTPSRTKPPGLIARIVLGSLAGAAIAAAGMQSMVLGAVLGLAGSIVGTFGGYEARTRLVKALRVPDLFIALPEDALAIGLALFIVTRF